jgi:LPXTG-motif cell wall-anchored protein
MDQLWEFLTSWTFMWILLGALVVLIGVFIFLRMRKRED